MDDKSDRDYYSDCPDEVDPSHDEDFDVGTEVFYRLHQGERLDIEDRAQFAAKIMRERQALNLTQARLAELSGVPVRTIKGMEASTPTVPQLANLLKLWDGITTAKGAANPEPVVTADWPADPVQILADVIGPMYAALTPKQQAEALRRIVLLLNEIKEN
ncbi:helix-turn-helix domain-containing protein [Nocardia sp. NBC_01499]|uniref:helix-turn-helix domain-containing protein n=1 Tax=Nocardia sp. NBC_01499 TaxID=2903597 RepID=UPI003867BB3E